MKPRHRTNACLLAVVVSFVGYLSGAERPEEAPIRNQPALRGICFGPYRANQNPNCGVYPTEEEIREELRFIKDAKIASKLRTYSCLKTLSKVPTICQELGIECWPGAWLGKNRYANEREIQALIEIGKKKLPNCPVLIVGNEVLLRTYWQHQEDELSANELIAVIERVKRETGSKVAYAEIGGVICQFPNVADAVDIVLVHLYPYWGKSNIEFAIDDLFKGWKEVTDKYQSKFRNNQILIGETGWPSAGGPQGQAVPSEQNQAKYINDFLRFSRENGVDYFYFSLFSESWKAKTGEGPQGANWGLFTEDGKLKRLLRDHVSTIAQAGMRRLPGVIPKAEPLKLPAYIYRDAGYPENRFIPTFFMGDVSDLRIDESSKESPHSGLECIKITYALSGRYVDGLQVGQRPMVDWAGIYWIGPYMNHTGEYPGYTLKGAKKLTFWARGERSGENVEFKIGGINSGQRFRDSFGPLPLGRKVTVLEGEWRQYSIDLRGANTSSLLSGFCFVVNREGNPNGCTFYLDDIVITGEQVPPSSSTRSAPTLEAGDINAIPVAIMTAQRNNVRESWGEGVDQCYTADEYKLFRSRRGADRIAAELLSTREIQAAILTLRNMSATELDLTTKQWRCPLRKTWAQLGRISREGQTDAGQKAENDIANAAVDAILQACRDPKWQPTTSK